MNPADDALDGPFDTPAPVEVFFLKCLADRASSIEMVVIALEMAVKYLRDKESEGYELEEPVDGGRVAIRLGP